MINGVQVIECGVKHLTLPHIVPFEAAWGCQGQLELSPINLTYKNVQLHQHHSMRKPKTFTHNQIQSRELQILDAWVRTVSMRRRSTEVQQGGQGLFHWEINTRPFFKKKKKHKRVWNHPWHPLLPTHINYFRMCLVIQAENPTQNEWDVSFMQLLVKALQGVKSRVDLNWSQQYRIRGSGD